MGWPLEGSEMEEGLAVVSRRRMKDAQGVESRPSSAPGPSGHKGEATSGWLQCSVFASDLGCGQHLCEEVLSHSSCSVLYSG